MQRMRDEWEQDSSSTGRGWLNGLLIGGVLWIIIIMCTRWL